MSCTLNLTDVLSGSIQIDLKRCNSYVHLPFIDPAARWFALAVKPGDEQAVARSLRGRGLEQYVPTYSGRRRLFPGFVFCRFDPQNRRAVPEIPGGLWAAGSPESASSVSYAEIARIKMILASRLPVRPRALLSVGQRVWIMRGPLAGLEGFLLRRRDDFQVVVGLEALRRSVTVDISRAMVCAVEGAAHAPMARLFMGS